MENINVLYIWWDRGCTYILIRWDLVSLLARSRSRTQYRWVGKGARMHARFGPFRLDRKLRATNNRPFDQ